MSRSGSGLEKLGDFFLIVRYSVFYPTSRTALAYGIHAGGSFTARKAAGARNWPLSVGIRIAAALVHRTSAIAVYSVTTFYRIMSYSHNTSYFQSAKKYYCSMKGTAVYSINWKSQLTLYAYIYALITLNQSHFRGFRFSKAIGSVIPQTVRKCIRVYKCCTYIGTYIIRK